MAAQNNFISKTESQSVASLIKCTIRKELVRNLLNRPSEKLTITKEALDEIVEVANCIVIETCMRAASRAASRAETAGSSTVTNEDVLRCLHQLMLDFP